MNQRERFLNTMRFKSVDRVPFLFPNVWQEALDRWYKEGLSSFEDLEKMYEYDNIWGDIYTPTGIHCSFCPCFEEVTLEEDERTRTYTNSSGVTLKVFKEGFGNSLPQYLDFPVKNRSDFEKIKYRTLLNEDSRFPEGWEANCEQLKDRNEPIHLGFDTNLGFYGSLREWMGVENLSTTFYDDPELIEEMMDNRMELILAVLDRVLKVTSIDYLHLWEDMAYKNGPLISPEMFRKFMLPRYRRITDFLRGKGVDIIIVDSDGDITKLIPLWIEAGVNGMLPFEVQSGMDVVKLREEYGNDLLMIGGIDKKALARSKSDIDAEIKRIAPLISKGGYIPWTDHAIPPDVSYENFLYFMDLLDKVSNT